MPHCCSRCECAHDSNERPVILFLMRMPEESTSRRIPFCEDCFLYYDSYCVDDTDLEWQEDTTPAEADPQDAECEDDPCFVLHYAVACGGDCAGDPM